MLLLSLSLITSPVKADCYSDGQKVIAACKAALDAKDLVISDESKTITDLQRALSDSNLVADSEARSLSAWYRNPFIVGTLGILAGGFAVVYLPKK